MSNEERDRLANYIRIYRRKSGMNQHELGSLVGHNARIVHRHERAIVTPSLEVAICYEIIFRVPVSELFAGLRDNVAIDIERKLEEFAVELGARSVRDRRASATARKLIWFTTRRSPELESHL